MCLIITKEKGKELPPEEHLKLAHLNNPHGSGIAYFKDGFNKVKIAKGFVTHKQLMKFIKQEKIDKDTTCVIHFRFATAGKKITKNNHPFPITKNKALLGGASVNTDYAFAHNGTIYEYNNDKKYSDTVLFCIDILSDPVIKNNLHNPIICKLLEDFVGGSKLAFIHKHKLHHVGNFVVANGCSYSNDSYKNKKFRLLSYSNNYNATTNIECEFCGKQGAYHFKYIDGISTRCCWDCHQKTILETTEDKIQCDYCGRFVKNNEVVAKQRYSEHLQKTVSAYVCDTCIKSYDTQLIYSGGDYGNRWNV